MCISNELCSDIAVALLVTKDGSDLELTQLKRDCARGSTALQQMTEVERAVGGRLRRLSENED